MSAAESKARSMTAREFFRSYYQTAEFMSLPLETRRDIVAGHHGLKWAEYSKLTGAAQSQLNMSAAGYNYAAGVDEGAAAAQRDGQANAVKSFFAGWAGGSALSFVAVAVLALLALPMIGKAGRA